MARTDPRPHYGTKRRVRPDGYVDVYRPDHPLARRDGYLFEHRAMAWDAGILTDPSHEVHHKNHQRADNRLDNFEVKTSAAHALDHQEERGWTINQHGRWPIAPRHERRSAPKHDRPCAGCDGTVPASVRRDARFCTPACRVRAFKRGART